MFYKFLLAKVQRTKDCRVFIPRGNMYSTTPPPKVQGPLWVRGWEEGKGKRRWVDDYCVFWKEQRAHMNSSNRSSMHKTWKPKRDHVSMKRGVEHNVPPLTEELLAVVSCGERKGPMIN